MPSINLRLTERELKELRVWAHDGKRSLQKEILWRLFDAEGHGAPKIYPTTGEAREGIEIPLGETAELVVDAQPRDIPARTVEFPGERTRGGPDPKPGQKR